LTEQPAKHDDDTTYCSLARRLLVMLYDGVVLVGLLMIAAMVVMPFGAPDKVAFRDAWFTAWLAGVCFSYLACCWRYGGVTLGMRAWRVRLVTRDGNRISWLKCLVRFIVGIVGFALFGLGLFWALPDKKNRSWHDLAAGTLLLRHGQAGNTKPG
jgi:uncharacterized RDD family membrane protein YckC